MAGGLGTRLRTVVSDVPKPMVLINGIPFIEKLIIYWSKKKIKNFYLLTGYKSEIIKSHFGNEYKDCNIFYSEEKERLGTGGALFEALNSFNQLIKNKNILLLNGDTWFDLNYENLIEQHLKSSRIFTMAITEISINNRYGEIKISKDGELISINKPIEEIKKSKINSGCYVIDLFEIRRYIDIFPKKFSLEDDLLPYLIKEKKIGTSFSNGEFIDIGIPSDLKKASQILRENF